MSGEPDPTYIAARRVLLDALEALKDHHSGLVLVGAQAIYIHTGAGELAIAPYTSDADLALDPMSLSEHPLLEESMRAAGFIPAGGDMIGTWIGAENVPVDLLVPQALAGPGKRAARLGVHGDRVARRGRGLEAALVDNALRPIEALDPTDHRVVEARVAGPASLLVAKLHKIADRQGGRRHDDKDALDAFRLLQAISTAVLVDGVHRLDTDELSGEVTREAINYLEALFGKPTSEGCQMAARAVELAGNPALVAESAAALTVDLLQAL